MQTFNDICEYCPNEKLKICTGGLIPNNFKTVLKNIPKDKRIGISLSGGVDSMISSWILKQLHNNVVAIHINYNNRQSSSKEAEFVKMWCDTIDLDCIIKHITNLNRIKHDNNVKCYKDDLEISRREYEDKTKQIRFDAYIDAKCIVVLGHNKDDLLENVITNICSKKKEKMAGMYDDMIIDNVRIIRPMLNITKEEIYEYAKKTNVPYLEDSTPEWSRRGILRDKIVPTLHEYEPNFLKGLIKLLETHELM